MKRDYEGGQTWEEVQSENEYGAANASGKAAGAGVPGQRQSGRSAAGGFRESDVDDEEDRILARTKEALRDYDDSRGEQYYPYSDSNPDGNSASVPGGYSAAGGYGSLNDGQVEGFVPYEGTGRRGTSPQVPGDAVRYTDPAMQDDRIPQYDPYTGRKLTQQQRKALRSRRKEEERYRKEAEKNARKSARRNTRDTSAQERMDRRDRKQKKHHPVRNFFLILLILLIVVPVLWILVQVRTMQSLGMDTEQIENSIADTVKQNIASGSAQGEYKNIALMGVDSVDNSLDSGNNRSDVMIIASINNTTGAIRLMSVYRDTYLDIGDGNYQKANAAYAYGGPDQTVQMLNRNLDLDITDYGVVGFEGIARLIDAVGGVEIDVQEDEIEHLNNYQITMSEETGLTNIPVTHAGTQTLNGLQATAYCRIRYTAGNDFRRTERQRTVLTKTFEKIKANPLRLVVNLNSILPYVKTSLSVPEMFSLGAKAMNFNVESQEGFPSQDMLTVGYINQQSCVIPITLARNVTWLHSELFGETDYQPSQTVQDISAYISSVTGYY